MRMFQAIAVAALAVVPVWSQGDRLRDQAAAPAGSASLTGAVQIMVSGQPAPVRRARVIVREAGGVIHTTDTDIQGQFRIDQLAGGSYRVVVDKPGFVPIGREPLIEVRAGQAAKATILMQRGAAIEGRLTTEGGEPAMGLTVSAVRLGYGPYGKKVVAARQTTTDDLGRFRLHTLMPGEYYIEAVVDPLRMLTIASTPEQKPARTFYAGTPRLTEASIVALTAEQQLGNVSFTVATINLALVAGSVVTSDGKPPASFSIRIQRVGAPPGEVRCALVSNRTFQCPNVPPGEFWLLVAARAAPDAGVELSAGRMSVEGKDLTDLVVTTKAGVDVTGRVAVEGGAPFPPVAQVAALETEYELPASAPGAASTAAQPVSVAPDGAFRFAGLVGARVVRLDRLPDGWALKGVWLGDVEISDTPTTFSASERPASVRVLVTPQTGSVEGTVTNADRQPATGARMIVFTDDPRRWGARSRFIKTTEVNAAGRYRVTGLLPGTYKVVCVDFLDDGAWEDPEVLARLAPIATSITVTGTERLTVDWRMR
jgi:Carboxypeptidase regulatory-like domain